MIKELFKLERISGSVFFINKINANLNKSKLREVTNRYNISKTILDRLIRL